MKVNFKMSVRPNVPTNDNMVFDLSTLLVGLNQAVKEATEVVILEKGKNKDYIVVGNIETYLYNETASEFEIQIKANGNLEIPDDVNTRITFEGEGEFKLTNNFIRCSNLKIIKFILIN